MVTSFVPSSFHSVRAAVVALVLIAGVTFGIHPNAIAQSTGISSDGRDYYIGYMPAGGEAMSSDGGVQLRTAYIMIGSFTNDNTVTVSYFGSDGSEIGGSSHTIQKGRCWQVQVPTGMMTPTMPGEMPEYKAAHIRSKYPVTVQFYMDGSNSGGLYMGIPTSALGTHYVTACYFDNPLQDNPSPAPYRDSTSSEFMIVAAYDNTNVVFTPNATTMSGVIGKNTGDGSNGTSHPVHIQLARGQVYWVRSHADNSLNDLTGSDIVSDKPIAVLGGQERGLLGDPGSGQSQWQDVRDVMVEEMTPVDSWDSEFVSIPFLPAVEGNASGDGIGDLYRVLSDNTNAGNMDAWIGAGATSPVTKSVSAFQSPATEFGNLTDAVDLLVSSTNKDGTRKKMYPVEYDYFQDNGAQDDYAYTTPNEQDVIALARFKTAAVFRVPQNSYYHGFQFINIITTKDSLKNISIVYNGGPATPLSSYPKLATYQIPLHPELIGFTSRVAPGDYFIYGNTPLACYSYARTEDVIKVGAWGYAAPCGMMFGLRTATPKPKIQVTPSCDHWGVTISDGQPGDLGIANIELLNDPQALLTHPAYVSYNTNIFPNPPKFIPGDTSVSFDVQINDITKDGYAAILITDRSGFDTVYELRSKAQEYTLSSTSAAMLKVDVGAKVCSTFSVVVQQTGSSDTMTIYPPSFAYGDKSFSVSSNPSLPKVMHPGDSVQFTVCFNSVDTFAHKDSLILAIGCGDTNYHVYGSGVTPIIVASNYDFGNVPVGDTVCKLINVRNTGTGPLILDKKWVLDNLSGEFSFGSDAQLPDTILPGKNANLDFCFHPTVKGGATAQMNWGTNLVSPFLRQLKDTSILLGYATQPGLNWNPHTDTFTVICEASKIDTVHLTNPSSGATGGDITVTGITIEGPDAKEFQIVGDQPGYLPLETQTWVLGKNDSIWVAIRFTPDLNKLYVTRQADFVVFGHDPSGKSYTDTLKVAAKVEHTILSIAPATYDFGSWPPGTIKQKTFVLTNSGDAPLIFTDLTLQNLLGSEFTMVSGPKIGDILAANGGFDTVVIQWTAASQGGTSRGMLRGSPNDTLCDSPQTAAQVAAATQVAVAGTGHAYPLTYICHNGSATVTASNGSTGSVILDSVLIIGPDADQFSFSDGTLLQSQTPFSILQSDSVQNFAIFYTPTRTGNVNASVVYIFDTTQAHADTALYTVIQPLSGIGYQTSNTVSLQRPGGGSYTTKTGDMVTIPVQLTKPFDSVANVYGAQFTVRYLRDQFRFQSIMPNTITHVGPTADPVDNNYELITFTVNNGSPITNLDTIAHITWMYDVAKDSSTNFEVRDLMFTDQTGASVCWVAPDTIPGQFYGTNQCGDGIVRHFMQSGQLEVSIQDVVPNPVTNFTRVNYQVNVESTPVTIEVFNSLGQKVATVAKDEVQQKGLYLREIDASSFAGGIYTLRISTPNSASMRSIVVTK
jgi:hypothetical protein